MKGETETKKEKNGAGKSKSDAGTAKNGAKKTKTEAAAVKKAKTGAASVKTSTEKVKAATDAVYLTRAGTEVYLKTPAAAAVVGKSARRLQQLVDDGILRRVDTPKGAVFELKTLFSDWMAMIESRAEKQKASNADPELEKLQSEVKYKAAKAELAEMDAKERAGRMHRSEDVADMTEDLVSTIRAELLAIPGRLAVKLLGLRADDENDLAKLSDVIRNDIYGVMQTLSEYEYSKEAYAAKVRERLKLHPDAEDDG